MRGDRVAQQLRGIGRRRTGLEANLTPRGRAVLRAFNEARRVAPGFVISCGVLPEISESASERIHDIVREVAEHLNGHRETAAVQRRLQQKVASSKDFDRDDRNLTALIGTQTTAAYLVGLSVGLALHNLPDRLNRSRR